MSTSPLAMGRLEEDRIQSVGEVGERFSPNNGRGSVSELKRTPCCANQRANTSDACFVFGCTRDESGEGGAEDGGREAAGAAGLVALPVGEEEAAVEEACDVDEDERQV